MVNTDFLVGLTSPHVLVTVPAWRYRGSGLQGHSGLLHCLTDGEEGD